MKKILGYINNIWCFVIGNLFALFTYKRKYLKGKYFEGRFGGVNAKGWKWVVTDCTARLFWGVNRKVPFPVSPFVRVIKPENIEFAVDDLNNFQGNGNYFQTTGAAKIIIGKGCWIAPNVGLITTNHSPVNPSLHLEGKDIILGENCWIGMNSVILPGITLGPYTTVGAGSVVTKSFEDGYCIIAGNPAKKIRDIEIKSTIER